MKQGHEISNEKNPVLREIYGLGYDRVIINPVNNTIELLCNETEMKRQMPLNDWNMMVYGLDYINAILYDGRHFSWVKNADGSRQKLIDFINTGVDKPWLEI